MKNWKISNTAPTKQPIKISMIINSKTVSSRGIILKHGEFCLAKPQITSSMDMQEKRKFITIDRNFDNSALNLNEGVAYSEAILIQVPVETEIQSPSKMEEAEKNAVEYIEKENLKI